MAATDGWIARDAGRALSDGLRLLRWWERADLAGSYKSTVSFLRDLTPPDRSFGFFDETEISTGPVEVMGLVIEMLFDRPKSGSAEIYRAQIREFVLRYFLRVSYTSPPQPKSELGFGPLTNSLLNLFHLGPRTDVHGGFRHTQLYYKEAPEGGVKAFPASERSAIVDLRDIGPKYDWIALSARPYDYELDLAPIGPAGPRVIFPLPDTPTIAINRDMVVDQDYPAPGVLGRYGFAYALLDDPTPRGFQVYGPAQFKAGFHTIHFEVLESGESRVRMAFAGNLPDKILDVKLDPIGMALRAGDFLSFGLTTRLTAPFQSVIAGRPTLGGFDPLLGFLSLANFATAGLASKELDISKRQLFLDILAKHFELYYQRILDSLLAYRQVRDWLDTARLPAWAQGGER